MGRVIADAGVVEFVKENAGNLRMLGILFPFIIAAILKIAQGSSTVAITTTAAMMGLTDPNSITAALGHDAGGSGSGCHGDRRGFNDGIPRERQLFLGRDQSERLECGTRL